MNDDKLLHTVIPDFVSQKKEPHDGTPSCGSPNGSDKLRYAERGKCRLIDCRCDRQSVVGLEICDGLLGHRPKDTIDRSIVITVALQLRLHIGNSLIGNQSIVSVDWAIVWIISLCVITPCRIPVARIPVIPAAVHKDDPIVMASPPIAIVPLPLVIADPRILLATKSTSSEVVISCFFFSSRRRHTRFDCDWSSDVCSSDLRCAKPIQPPASENVAMDGFHLMDLFYRVGWMP